MSMTPSMTRANKRRSKAKEVVQMRGSKEPTFFARLPLAEAEGVVISEEGQMEEGPEVIMMGQVVGVEAGAAQDTGAEDAIDLILLSYYKLHNT